MVLWDRETELVQFLWKFITFTTIYTYIADKIFAVYNNNKHVNYLWSYHMGFFVDKYIIHTIIKFIFTGGHQNNKTDIGLWQKYGHGGKRNF